MKIEKSLSFDDILLIPRNTDLKREDIDTSSRLTEDIELKVPILSSPMDKVTGSEMAIAMAREGEEVVYITVAGRSNALSGFVDAQTEKPVIACPPYSSKFAGADIFSSLRMPSGVCPMVIMGTEQAGLAAAKIFGVSHEEVRERIKKYQKNNREQIDKDDKEVR